MSILVEVDVLLLSVLSRIRYFQSSSMIPCSPLDACGLQTIVVFLSVLKGSRRLK